MVQFSAEQREMQAKVVEMLNEVIKLYKDARTCLENYDNKGAERRLDTATRIVDNITKLTRM